MSSAHRGYCRAEGAERPGALAQAVEQLEKSGKPFREADVLQRAYDNAMRQYGTGSDLQKAAQAVTGALAALAGNNGGCAGERRLAVPATEIKSGSVKTISPPTRWRTRCWAR